MNTFDYDSLDQTDIGTNDITILPEYLHAKKIIAVKQKQPKKDKKKLFHKFTS